MDRVSTLFLKVTILLIVLAVLALCIFGVPWFARESTDRFPAYSLYSVLAGMYAAAIPFSMALYQAFKILTYIDKDQAFSDLSVSALKNIKYCAVVISLLYVAVMPFLYVMAEKDDAPGMIVIGLVVIFASAVIAVFAAVLQKLLKNAIDIKSENDLTV